MSQHDFTIANQSFPGFRSDLNNALQALVTHSSGSSAPSPTFTYQIWVDTSSAPAVLKLRNGDNDAWISLGNIDNGLDSFSLTGSVALTGTSTAQTPSASDDSTKIATTAFVRDIIPTGVIVMWSGSIASIPAGWYLCDGSNGTPDLRNKFVIAASADDSGTAKTAVTGSATQSGGSKDAITVSHTHSTSVTDAGHRHFAAAGVDAASVFPNFTVTSGNQMAAGNGSSGGFERYILTGVSDDASVARTSAASTGISVSNTSTGSSGTNANLPPYYALAYIMKA